MQVVERHAIAGLQSFLDCLETVEQLPQFNTAIGYRAVLIDNVHELFSLVGANSPLVHQKDLVRGANFQTNANEQPRHQHRRLGRWIVGIGKRAAHQNRSRLRIYRVIDEIKQPLQRELTLNVVDQPHLDYNLAQPLLQKARSLHFLYPQQRRLLDIEIAVDRIDRHDRGQQRGVGIDQVSLCQQRPADPSRNRRHNLGESQIQFRLLKLSLSGFQGSDILRLLSNILIEVLLAAGPLLGQFAVPVDLNV